MSDLEGIPGRPGATANKLIVGYREATLYPTITGARILIGPPGDIGGDEEYMFVTLADAVFAFDRWDGYGEPDLWVRHTLGIGGKTQVRRRNYNTGEITVESRV